jgi:hypothetical protein
MTSQKPAHERARLGLLALAGHGQQRADAMLKLLLTRGLPALRALATAWWAAALRLLRQAGAALQRYIACVRAW